MMGININKWDKIEMGMIHRKPAQLSSQLKLKVYIKF